MMWLVYSYFTINILMTLTAFIIQYKNNNLVLYKEIFNTLLILFLFASLLMIYIVIKELYYFLKDEE